MATWLARGWFCAWVVGCLGCPSSDKTANPGSVGSSGSGGLASGSGGPGTGGSGGGNGNGNRVTAGGGLGGLSGGATSGSGGRSSGPNGTGGGDGGGPRGGDSPRAGSGGTPAPASGSGGASIGGGAGGGTSLTQPIARPNGRYTLEFGDVLFEVNPAVGARVTALRFAAGANLLTGPTDDPMNFGSTFRTSPQSAWNWPPPPQIDSLPYTMSVTGQTMVATGSGSTVVGAAVTKKFSADLVRQAVVAEYTIRAQAAGKSFAPWEVTRVFPGGLTFYPTGLNTPTTSGTFTLPVVRQAAGCTWFQYPPAGVTASQRLIADGSGGWLAHVAGDVLLVKKFPDIPVSAAAPGEGEISIYVDGAGHFVELEEQGAYQPLASGQSVAWAVTWYVRRLPAGVAATIGNQQLVDYVRALIQ
jgi:Domain of unknown function (DUF4380)